MKRIYGNPRGLFAPILIALFLLTSMPAAAKVHYRGFVEGGLGVTTVSGESGRIDRESGRIDNGGGVKFGYMLATTHGIQWKNNFFGAGIGITPGYCAVGSYSRTTSYGGLTVTNAVDEGTMSKVTLPVYLNWRYDFFSMGEWAPYVGIKAGLFLAVSDFEVEYPYNHINKITSGSWSNPVITYEYGYYHEFTKTSEHVDVFVSLDFGIRKTISRNTGVSFGLSIQPSKNAKAEIRDWDIFGLRVDLINELGVSVLAKVAFDF